MSNISNICSKLRTLIENSQSKNRDNNGQKQSLLEVWKGMSKEAFQEAYEEIPTRCKKIDSEIGSAKGSMNSLDYAIEEAERDKERKRQLKLSKR